MFYYLSKIVWFFTTPSNLLPSLVLVGLILVSFTRLRRGGIALAMVSTLLIFFCGLSPVANWVILPLEQRFPSPTLDDGRVDGIIVLGGSVMADETMMRGQLVVNEAGERVIVMGDLARRFPSARIIFSGGGGTLIREGYAEADAVRAYAATLGVDPTRIEIESQSRTTWENAVLARQIVTPKPGERWLLVTSAWHMPRAVGCFRNADFSVTPYPVDFRTRGPQDVTRTFAFTSEGMRRLDTGAKEWFGLIAYWLAGYIPELLPRPDKKVFRAYNSPR